MSLLEWWVFPLGNWKISNSNLLFVFTQNIDGRAFVELVRNPQELENVVESLADRVKLQFIVEKIKVQFDLD